MRDIIQNWANIISEGSGRISESKVDFTDKIFFHGSKNSGVLKQLKAPSPDNIFFVTNDLDYAWKYTEKNTDETTRNVYVVSLNQEELNVFDPWKDSDKIEKLWTHDFTDVLKHGLDSRFDKDPKDLMLILTDICMYYETAKKYDFDFIKFIEGNEWVANSFDYVEDSPYYIAFKFINEMLKKRRDIFEPIFEMQTDSTSSESINWKRAKELRKVFCRDLKSLGFNAFKTEEQLIGVRSNECYGIFDKDAFDSFMVIPINEEKAKKALDALEYVDDEEYGFTGKNRTKSNSIIDIFIQEYKRK